jgi:hypothetical protein
VEPEFHTVSPSWLGFDSITGIHAAPTIRPLFLLIEPKTSRPLLDLPTMKTTLWRDASDCTQRLA